MTKGKSRFDDPIPANAVCADPACGHKNRTLHWHCLTGSGDHPRYFLLCADCLKKWKSRSPTVGLDSATASPVMTEQEKRQETRNQRALDRLGSDHPICACCGGSDHRYMELHHLAGKDFDGFLVNVCRNDHRILSNMQKDHPAKLGKTPTALESIGHFLMGLADLLLLIAGKLWELGEDLIEKARQQAPKAKPARS